LVCCSSSFCYSSKARSRNRCTETHCPSPSSSSSCRRRRPGESSCDRLRHRDEKSDYSCSSFHSHRRSRLSSEMCSSSSRFRRLVLLLSSGSCSEFAHSSLLHLHVETWTSRGGSWNACSRCPFSGGIRSGGGRGIGKEGVVGEFCGSSGLVSAFRKCRRGRTGRMGLEQGEEGGRESLPPQLPWSLRGLARTLVVDARECDGGPAMTSVCWERRATE
jgi:hypothetical protein